MTTTLDIEHLTDLLYLAHPTDVVAVGVAPKMASIEFALKPLSGDEAVDQLLGFRAPDHWSAFAIVGPGRLLTLERAPYGADLEGDVQLVHLVARDGRTATRVGTPDRPRVAGGEPCGWIPDLCRRVLALPTPAPSTTTAELLAAIWLERILDEILRRDLDQPPPDWPACRSLLAPDDPLSDSRIQRFGTEFARRWPWAIVRRHATQEPLFGLSTRTAAWLDDGSFSRYVLGGFGPVDEARGDLSELLGAGTASRLQTILDHWLETGDR